MIATVIGIRRVSGKGQDGRAYDYFRTGYTYAPPKHLGFEGLLGGSCSIGADFFPVRIPHVGDKLVIDINDAGRVLDAQFLEDALNG